jgi:hypothetical protein
LVIGDCTPGKRLRFLLICATRFPRLSCNFDAVACSRNRHDVTLYSTDSQFTNIPTEQRKIPPTELPGSNDDSLGVVDRHKYYKETCHEMRKPAVDPRKSRRHGTDFGLGRHKESSLTVLSSDHPSKAISVSLPLTIMPVQDNPATDGDSVSSLFEYALEFPQPPPIGSPVIRRMRSSPWFSDKGCMSEEFSNQGSRRPRRSASVLLDSDLLGPCYSISSLVTQHPTMRREIKHSGRRNFSDMVKETTDTERARLRLSPYLDLGINDVSLEMAGEALVGLDMNASTMGPQELFLDNRAYGAAPSCDERSQASDSGLQLAGSHLDWSIPSDLLQWSTSHRSPPVMLAPMSQQRVTGEDTLHNVGYRSHSFRTKTNPVSSLPSEYKSIRSLGRLPRIIRKVASMKSDSRRPNDSIPLELPGPRTIPKSRSFRSIPQVACEAGNNSHSTITTIDGGPYLHNDRSFANIDYFSSSKYVQDLKCSFSPTLDDSLEHCKGRGAQHMSLPSSGFGSLRSEPGQHKDKVTTPPMALSGPFLYRETCNRQSAKSENDLPIGMDKSFIDITPKQGAKHERSAAATKRARVKKLIARASNGIIGWGRQLTRKTSSVK